jgi:tetratricopeptide (TPR) repeat protein
VALHTASVLEAARETARAGRLDAERHARRADEYQADGKPDDAIVELDCYFAYRPHDKKRRKQYALLLHDRARLKGAPSYQVREAMHALDKALRGTPDDDELREIFAEFALAAGESSTARTLLKILRQQLGVKGLPMADPADDSHAVKLDMMYAKACINIRLDDEAMDVLGTMTGYIPVIRAFDPTIQPPRGGPRPSSSWQGCSTGSLRIGTRPQG